MASDEVYCCKVTLPYFFNWLEYLVKSTLIKLIAQVKMPLLNILLIVLVGEEHKLLESFKLDCKPGAHPPLLGIFRAQNIKNQVKIECYF